MTNRAEDAMLGHLTEAEALEEMAAEGLSNEDARVIFPTELVGKMVGWAIRIYFDSGRREPPTLEGIQETWADELEALEIHLDELVEQEVGPVNWAIEQLRGQYAHREAQQMLKEIGEQVANAGPGEKVTAVANGAGSLYLLAGLLTSRRQEASLPYALEDALQAYEAREASGQAISGLTLGLPEIDAHTKGTRPGELAVMAAFSGVGKSWVAAYTMLAEWRAGRQTVLFTLENDVEMTAERVACMMALIEYEDWQALKVSEDQKLLVKRYIEELKDSPCAPMVIQSDKNERDPVSLVRRALSMGADSLIIDQLSHMTLPGGRKRREVRDEVSEKIELLTAEIQGREKLPCLLFHQINRAGNDQAAKTGRYTMSAMADSSRVERDATHVFAIYRSDAMRLVDEAQIQLLKNRRGTTKDWELTWAPQRGQLSVTREVKWEGVAS